MEPSKNNKLKIYLESEYPSDNISEALDEDQMKEKIDVIVQVRKISF